MITGDEFFVAPRESSILKYKVLSCYFSQYFPKVNKFLGMGAVVADLFAGRGRFEDGSEGSPLIMARRYNDLLGVRNVVVMSEEEPDTRSQLENNLKDYIEDKTVTVLTGDASDTGTRVLNSIPPGVPLFVFLDPFGIKGLSLDLLRQIFQRAKRESTEVLVNFNQRALPRLAGWGTRFRNWEDKDIRSDILWHPNRSNH